MAVFRMCLEMDYPVLRKDVKQDIYRDSHHYRMIKERGKKIR